MLKTFTLRHCSPACDLRKICHSPSAGLPRTHTLGVELRRYCRNTRRWVIGGIAAGSVIAVAIMLAGGLA